MSSDGSLPSRQSRPRVMLSAMVKRSSGDPVTKHRVRDLSQGGMRLDQAGSLRVGATVLVTIGALEAIGATVAWVQDGFAGLHFVEAIDTDQARAHTAITPGAPPALPDGAPTAGWTHDLQNAYRKRE